MELCLTQCPSTLPNRSRTLKINPIQFQSENFIFLKQSVVFRARVGLQSRRCSLDKSVSRTAISEERSDGSGSNQYVMEEREEVIIDSPPSEKNVYGEYMTPEVPKEELTEEVVTTQAFEFLDKLKVDSGDTYGLVLFGTSSLVGVWLASAVVGAIDSIPVFPKLMEVVGLAYTVWFTSRYLLFKESRDELGVIMEGLKKQVLGSNDD